MKRKLLTLGLLSLTLAACGADEPISGVINDNDNEQTEQETGEPCQEHADCGNDCLFCTENNTCAPVPAGKKFGSCKGNHQQCNGEGSCECTANRVGDKCDKCPEGWSGYDCMSCDSKHFGENCEPCTCQHGVCSSGHNGKGTCRECEDNWQGENCDECAAGYYGADCKKCDCGNQFCEDGKNGSGRCYTCPTGFKGLQCDQCIDPHKTVDSNCTKCDSRFVDDGVCTICNNGGFGENCDCFDNHKYKTIEINGKTWMAENLKNQCIEHFSLLDNSGYDEEYGLYYTWRNALYACPKGWHIPSVDEYKDILVKKGTTGDNMDNVINDITVFSEPLPGWRHVYGYYEYPDQYGEYWSSTFYEQDIAHSSNYAYTLRVIKGTKAQIACERIGFGLSVRCVKSSK